MGNDNHIIATFDSSRLAGKAAEKLLTLGITEDQISLMVSDEGRGHHFAVSDNQTKTAEGVGYGAVLGGLVAALAAAAIPGSFFIAGPAAALLASSASGAMAGGLAGGLIGMGIPEDEVKLVEEDIGNGDILLAVHSIDDQKGELVKKSLEQSEAKRVH